VLLVVDQQLGDDIGSHIVLWHERQNAAALLRRKVEFHVAGYFLELIEELFLWGSKDVVDSVNLIKFVGAREEWGEGKHLEKDATNAPIIHLMVIISIC